MQLDNSKCTSQCFDNTDRAAEFIAQSLRQGWKPELPIYAVQCQYILLLLLLLLFPVFIMPLHNGGIPFLSCSCVHPCVRPETLLTRYLAEYLKHFHQTETNASQFWDQKVKGQGYGGIKYAGNSTFWAC